MPSESSTSIRVTNARAESFDSGDGINGGTTNKVQTFASAKEHHTEPGSTIDGPGCNGQGGPEVPGECAATVGQSRETDTPTSVLQREKVVDDCFLFFMICLLSGEAFN